MEKEIKNNLFGSYIKDYLEEKGISNKQVQEDLNVSQQYVSGIVTGKKTIGKKLAKKLSDLYGLDEGILLTGNLDKSENKIIWTQKKDDSFEKRPINEQMNMLYRKIEKLESTIDVLKERDQLYFKAIIAHLGIDSNEEIGSKEGEKSKTN